MLNFENIEKLKKSIALNHECSVIDNKGLIQQA